MEEADTFGFQCCVISTSPKIILLAMDVGSTGYKRFSDGTSLLFHLAKLVGKGHIIVNPWWAISAHGAWTARLAEILTLQRSKPQVAWHFFCNEAREVEFVRKIGLDAELINHNIFAHENVFQPRQAEKKFNAIYNAKMVTFKRHVLASKIDGLALIYSKYGEPGQFAKVSALLPNAYFVNGDPDDGSYKSYTSEGVVDFVNASRVGLCLSSEEGAMYASIEYLLCGLPIVSTRSTGGRDTFFDSRFCYIVDDEASAVAKAVETAIAQNFDPQFIKSETLKKIQVQREALIKYIEKLHADEGLVVDGGAIYEKMVSVPWTCWSWKNIRQLRAQLG